MALTKRLVKGTELTYQEGDDNLDFLDKKFVTSPISPTTSNDTSEGYYVNSIWLNTATEVFYRCEDAGVGIATWGVVNFGIVDHQFLMNIGVKTHLEIDAFIATKDTLNGLASLDGSGTVPSNQLPSYVDDILEYADFTSLPATGVSGKIYVTLDTNLTYRWGGSAYTEISPSLVLGETSLTAYRGDRGKTAYDHSLISPTSVPIETGEIAILNIVTLTQTNYDAIAVPVPTTLYVIQ